MDWLTESALLNMPGPNFLGFYAVFAALVIAAVNIVARWDGSESQPPPRVPARPDPYEIAFLRGGVGAVIVLAIYALKRADLVEMHAGGKFSRLPGLAMPLHPIEDRVLETIGAGASAREILRSGALRAAVEGRCEILPPATRAARAGGDGCRSFSHPHAHHLGGAGAGRACRPEDLRRANAWPQKRRVPFRRGPVRDRGAPLERAAGDAIRSQRSRPRLFETG